MTYVLPDSSHGQVESAEDEIRDGEREEEGRRRLLLHGLVRHQDEEGQPVADNPQDGADYG